ncbi:MAG: alpha/beta fold hydrolase [Burkholderiales bacterium]|nr:alpha/beta fold hydrolase [Burkholderiales bacterium]
MPIQLFRFLVRLLPAALALRIVRALATRSQRSAATPEQQQALAGARRLQYGESGSNAAWAWGDSGPLVVFVHGWNGSAAQMAPLAAHVAALGFRSVAIDVTGHGASPGQRTDWACFINDVAALQQSLGEEVHAYVGHSAGAMTLMAARAARGVRAARYVSICAPSHPFPPIEVIRKRLNPPEAVLALYRGHIARQFGRSWEQLEAGAVWAGTGAGHLLFYDEGDRFVPHAVGDRVLGWCPGARLVKTQGYGHTRVLASPELAGAVGGFLLQPAPDSGE